MSKSYGFGGVWSAVLAVVFACSPLQAQSGETHEAAKVAHKLQNPIADLITLPLESNFNFGIGSGDQFGYILNIQPVLPIPLGTHLKVVSRSIVPVEDQPATSGDGRTFGLADWTQSFFFAPAGDHRFVFGIGPVFSIPIATSSQLGSGKWGVGPTGVALYNSDHGWTAGFLTNQIWSFAGPSDRSNVSQMLLQPFVAYTTKIALAFKLQVEATYDWIKDQWTVPIEFGPSQTVKLGKVHLSIAVEGRVWVAGPSSAPDWAIRLPITFVVPGFSS